MADTGSILGLAYVLSPPNLERSDSRAQSSLAQKQNKINLKKKDSEMGQEDRSEVILCMIWDLKLKELCHPIWSRRSLSLLHTHHRAQETQYSQFYH